MTNPSLTPSIYEAVKNSRDISIERGEMLTTTETINGAFLVESGLIKRFEIKNNGSINIHGIYGAGDFIGLSHIYNLLFNKNIYSGDETYYYETVCNSVIKRWVDESILATVKNNPNIYKELFAISGDHARSSIWLLENRGLENSRQKVAHLILYLIDRYGHKTISGSKISVSLTQQDFADILNITRETVSIAISELKAKGILSEARSIIAPDLDKLRRAAYDHAG